MKQFLPFLTNDIGKTLDVDDAVVVTRALPTPLDNSPDGWEKNTIQFARNNEFRGMIKSYTTTLKFYLKGAKILRNAFYRLGMEAVIYFIWLKLDQSFGGGMTYRSFYKGECDFGTFKDDYNGVSVNITEGGFYKDLQANKAVLYEILPDDDLVSVYMDGVPLHNTVNYTTLEISEGDAGVVGGANAAVIPIQILVQEGGGYGLSYLNVSFENINNTGNVFAYIQSSSNWMISNGGTVPVTFPISGHIDIKCLSSFSGNSTMSLYLVGTIGLTNYYILNNVNVNPIHDYTYPFSFNITLQPGENLFPIRYLNSNGIDASTVIQYQETSELIVKAVTLMPATISFARKVMDMGRKIIGKVSPLATLTSPLLDSDDHLLVTSGDCIRSLPGASIKSTFSDWNKSVDAVFCTALDVVDGLPVLKDRYACFDQTKTVANLGECNNWTLSPAPDYIYDGVAVGYPPKDASSNIDINGKYSFNNTSHYKLDTTRRVVNEYDATSKYFADPYDIELIRVNNDGKDTTTASTDNSVFLLDAEQRTNVTFTGAVHIRAGANTIQLVGNTTNILFFTYPGARLLINGVTYKVDAIGAVNGTTDITFTVTQYIPANIDFTSTTALVTNLYQLRRDSPAVSGVPIDGGVFNVRLSPARILQRHYRWLRSSLDHLDSHFLTFTSTDKNKDLVSLTLGGVTIVESADIMVGSMGTKVYLPYLTTCDVVVPYALIDLMAANNGGKFDYTFGGVPLSGYPIQVTTEETHSESQNFSLLLCGDNDLTKLINDR